MCFFSFNLQNCQNRSIDLLPLLFLSRFLIVLNMENFFYKMQNWVGIVRKSLQTLDKIENPTFLFPNNNELTVG